MAVGIPNGIITSSNGTLTEMVGSMVLCAMIM